jgi:succinate dehydrogenase/fumarate reductase flavoprotein subunit
MNTKSLDHTITTEILIIGGGFAGCFAAIKAKQAGKDVLVVDKGYISRSCQSMYPSGNIGVCLPDHDKNLWMRELIEGGEYINDQEWVKIQVEETYPLVEELDGYGRELGEEIFIRDQKGEFLRVKVHGDVGTENIVIVGHPLMDTLRKKLIKEKIPFLERIAMSDLITDGERVLGAVGFNYRTGETYLLKAQAVILAAAGCNFRFDLTRKNMTGEGQVMAYEAGARLRNLDITDGSRHKVLEDMASYFLTFVFGWGGKFVNALGEEFMLQYDPTFGNLSTTKREYACRQEEKAGRGPICLDLTQIPLDKQLLLKKIRPENFRITQAIGKDAFKERFELQKGKIFAPLGTVSNGGGVDIDTRCATTIQGLYAIGDNACAPQQGTHGVGGQNLAFCLTSGNQGGKCAVEYVNAASSSAKGKKIVSQAKEHVNRLSLPLLRTKGTSPDEITWKIQSLFIPFDKVVSHQSSLEKALAQLEKIKEADFPSLKASDYHQLEKALGVRSMLMIAEGMLKSMLFREESRGFLVREDFPMTDNIHWLKWVVVEKKDGRIHLTAKDIPTPYVEPPRTVFLPKQRRTPV